MKNKNDFLKHVAINIRNLRERSGLTKEKLSKQLNVSVASLSSWENGDHLPSLNNVARLCNYYRISVSALISKPDSI